MASNNHPKADPAELKARVWVIESREIPSREWRTYGIREDRYPEWQLVKYCEELSELNHTAHDFRYRAATLTFDDDGRNCTIY